MVCWRGLPELAGGAGPSAARRAVAQVVHARRRSADRPALERDWGTAAAVTAAVLGGAHIVRVHAVAEMVQVVRVAEEIQAARRRSR